MPSRGYGIDRHARLCRRGVPRGSRTLLRRVFTRQHRGKALLKETHPRSQNALRHVPGRLARTICRTRAPSMLCRARKPLLGRQKRWADTCPLPARPSSQADVALRRCFVSPNGLTAGTSGHPKNRSERLALSVASRPPIALRRHAPAWPEPVFFANERSGLRCHADDVAGKRLAPDVAGQARRRAVRSAARIDAR